MQETQVQPPGQEGPLEKEMATHSYILAWKIPEKPGELQSMGLRVGHNLVTKRATLPHNIRFWGAVECPV